MPTCVPQFKACPCGSCLPRRELIDAAGIFCTFVCDKCEGEERKQFNPRIFAESYDPDKPDVEFASDF
jgi:hypothetical protein